MELSKNIVKKYNILYREVAKYYNLEHKVKIGAIPLNYILITDFGYGSKPYTNNVIIHITNNFTYFVPFYKFLHREQFCTNISPAELLKDINEVIKKIRKEKNQNAIK